MKVLRKRHLEAIRERFARIYGEERADVCLERFTMLVGRYGTGGEKFIDPPDSLWDETDIVLITYADMVQRPGEPTLQTLARFCRERLKGAIKTVHLLPFYPWTSDDGFSVVDYKKVNPPYGDWSHVDALDEDFDLMFDFVLNHCSAESPWFKDFVTGIEPARDYFLPMDPKTDLSAVVRPRPWPLLTRFTTRDGEKWVWTTFSEDQVDLNWKNTNLMFEFLDILFFYLSHGARILRLDAVAFLWKELGTNCLHLPQTHEVVKLFRDIVDTVAPEVLILTETNVPHKENISYFGEGDEAHMVYNFSLPPLVLHALLRGDNRYLQPWADSLSGLQPGTTFFNFTASHDGVGVRPLQGIVPDEELSFLVDEVEKRGGKVSMKANSDGSKSPYELNITYASALSEPDDIALGHARFLCSQAIMLAFRGMPAVYFHSLMGTPNWQEGYEETGQPRTLNRRKWNEDELNDLLNTGDTQEGRLFNRYLTILQRRRGCPSFHPDGGMEVHELPAGLFGFTRTAPDGSHPVLCLFNLTASEQTSPPLAFSAPMRNVSQFYDVLAAAQVSLEGDRLVLKPYQALWLQPR